LPLLASLCIAHIFPSLCLRREAAGLFAPPISNFRLKPWLWLTDSRAVTA
jgi:hypothetical protein